MRLINEQFLATPYYGSRQMARWLRRQGDGVGRHRVRRLMALMGLHAIYQEPRTSQPHLPHRIYPYLLRNLTVQKANQVWCTDISYIPLKRGFLYLVAIMDWQSCGSRIPNLSLKCAFRRLAAHRSPYSTLRRMNIIFSSLPVLFINTSALKTGVFQIPEGR